MLQVAFVLAIVGFVYYYIFVVQRPYLYLKSELISRFFERCKSPTTTIWPTPFLYRTGVLQTLFGASVKGTESPVIDLPYDRESVRNDVTLDWISPLSSDVLPLGVLVIINHGYGGRLVNGFINVVARKSRLRHIRTVIISIAGIESLSLSVNVSLQAALNKIDERMGSHIPKTLLAFSLGGIPALKLALQQPPSATTGGPYFSAAALVSTPLDDVRGTMTRANAASNLMLATAKELVKTHAEFVTSKWPELISRAMDATTLGEFHTQFVSVAFEQGDLNLNNIIDQISFPCIFFNAVDDPIVDVSSVDLVRLMRKPEIATVIVEQGGHCGFFAGWRGHQRWVSDYAIDFLLAAITPII